MEIGQLLFGFDGRISRGKFWLGFLLSAIFLVVCAIGAGHTKSIARVAIIIVMIIGYVWMRVASYVKRLHDMDTGGGGSLFMFWPFFTNLALFIYSGIVPGTAGPNRFGADPKNQAVPTTGPHQMSLGYILFSFQGRINRAKYWLIMVVPLILVVIGLMIGGILVAQSMIATAKVQAFCRQEGKNYPDCKEMAAFSDVFNKMNDADKSKYNNSPQAYCESLQREKQLSGSCDEFLQINQDWLNKHQVTPGRRPLSDLIPTGADNLMPAAGGEPSTKLEPNSAMTESGEHKDASQQAIADTMKKLGMGGIAALAGLWIGIVIVMYLPLYWAIFAVTAKRLHDRNLSGWWQAAPLVLSLIGTAFTFLSASLLIVSGLFSLLSFIGSLALFIICGFIPGNPGTNKFGADPLQRTVTGVVA